MSDFKDLPLGTILPLAGVSFHQKEVLEAKEGDPVLLWHDTANPQDPDAIAVSDLTGRILGHIPRRGDLNARLARNHPGGRWNGVIHEVLKGETTGLRISLGELVGTGDGRVASATKGLRHLDDGIDDQSGKPTPVEPAALKPASTKADPGLLVHGPGGRVLGNLIEETGEKLRVMNSSGVVMTYPRSLCKITESQAS